MIGSVNYVIYLWGQKRNGLTIFGCTVDMPTES